MKVAYLGPQGSYSRLAAQKLCPDGTLVPYPDFRQVMQALIKGECDYSVAPIENSLNGSVMQNIDLLQYTDGVAAVKSCKIQIEHRLASLGKIEKVERIYSHQQALEQCGEYLAAHFPYAKQIAVASTAASLEMLKTERDVCIVGAHAKKDGIVLLDENIADEKNNFTQFLLIARGETDKSAHSERVFFSCTCPHVSGALLVVLQILAGHGVNMTKMQSRPIKDKPGEYRFFIEVEGDYSSATIQNALEEVRSVTSSLKVLGAY